MESAGIGCAPCGSIQGGMLTGVSPRSAGKEAAMSAGGISPAGSTPVSTVLNLSAGQSSSSEAPPPAEVERMASPRQAPPSASPPGIGKQVDVVA